MNRIRLISLLLLLPLLCLPVLPAFAVQTPDLTRTGSIRLTMRYHGEAIGGGELTLYQVATVRVEDGSALFQPVAGLEDVAFSAEALAQTELAGQVLSGVKAAGISGQTKQIGSDGSVRFDGLSLGLYLLEQTTAAPGYSRVSPFLVSLPLEENGELIYDVDASPKPEPLQPAEPEPTVPTDTAVPANPPSPVLPQTGQLNWPIPVLLTLGCICLAAGLLLLRRERK